MSKEVDNIIPFPGQAEPVRQQTPVIPQYVVEEEDDEEETLTIDFDSNKVFSKEDSWVLRDAETKEVIMTGGSVPASEDHLKKVFENAIDVTGAQTFGTPRVAELSESIEPTAPAMVEKAPGDEFKEELQDLFMNALVSKAVASLLSKYHELDNEIDDAISKAAQGMGDMSRLIADGIDQVMDIRRKELRACYNGATVRYENIPEWAKTYVRDYVRERVMEVSMLSRF